VITASPLTRPLLDGEVTARGVPLQVSEAKDIDDNARRMARAEFDFGDTSISAYLRSRDQGVRVIGLPLFTSTRRFPHANFRISTRAGIRELAELRGRTVGATQYWTASSIWQRQFLGDVYGLDPEDVGWVTFQSERVEGLEVPSGLRHRLDTSGVSAEELAEAGELDATLTAGAGPRRRGDASGPPVLVPAFPDPAAAQREYYLKTGIYPIQHLVVMREELAEREPEIVARVCEAFVAAKKLAQAREAADDDSPRARENRELANLMGDAWPYGISANRTTLAAFADASFAQGLTSRRYAVDELFPATLPDSMR
jgi:4,5-dihydroxyphthalate decarboxylase